MVGDTLVKKDVDPKDLQTTVDSLVSPKLKVSSTPTKPLEIQILENVSMTNGSPAMKITDLPKTQNLLAGSADADLISRDIRGLTYVGMDQGLSRISNATVTLSGTGELKAARWLELTPSSLTFNGSLSAQKITDGFTVRNNLLTLTDDKNKPSKPTK
jgi:hypothetical protein